MAIVYFEGYFRMNDINPPIKSKINWTATIQSSVNVGSWWLYQQGYLPQEAMVDVLVVANTISAGVIYVFRTWFTKGNGE